MSESRSFKIGRSAKTGKFTSIAMARRHDATHVVEHVSKRRRGDTGRQRNRR